MLENECRQTNFTGYRRNPQHVAQSRKYPAAIGQGRITIANTAPHLHICAAAFRARGGPPRQRQRGMAVRVTGEAAEIDRIGLHNVYPANKWRGTLFAHSALQLLFFFLAFSFRTSHIPQTAVRNLVCPTAPASFLSFSPRLRLAQREHGRKGWRY